MKIKFLSPRILRLVFLAALPHAGGTAITSPAHIYETLDQVYAWQAERLEPHRNQSIIGWKHATFYTGVMELYRATGRSEYIDLLREIAEDHNWRMLTVNQLQWRHADNHLIGETYINLFLEDADASPIRLMHVNQIFSNMIAQPIPGRQIYNWCDALFMSPPVWAQLAALREDDVYLRELDDLWWDATDFLYDPEHRLYFRDADYFNALEPNGMPVFWGRGNGWVMGGLVRVLQYMPGHHGGRQAYVDLFVEMAEKIADIQMDNGAWATSLLYPERFDFEPEMSATGFFVYSLAWGINNGLLSKDRFGPVVETGWATMNDFLEPDGSIRKIQAVGKDPVPWDGGVEQREYGYGAFILAGIEMASYYKEKANLSTWHGFDVITHMNGTQWVDSGSYLGMVEVSRHPYVYSETLGAWLYAPEDEGLYTEAGAWVRFLR